MRRSFSLLLPALFPSWRFFRTVEASPRIEMRPADAGPEDWRPVRPRPDRIGAATMLGRLFWNPGWNEALYLTSLAERIVEDGRDHAKRELVRRIRADLGEGAGEVHVRILLLSRNNGHVISELAWIAPATGAP